MSLPIFLHYFSAVLVMMLGVVGGGIAQGVAGLSTLESTERQPTGGDSLFKSLIIGLALIESGLIIALVMSLMVLFSIQEITLSTALCELGMGLAIGAAAASVSVASSFVVRAASFAISRQPYFAQKIITIMLMAQTLIEAPVIFAFIISLLIKTNISPAMTVYESVRFLAAALAVALGCIGPSVGQGLFANAACSAIGLNRRAYEKIFPFTLVVQAVIETPMIFSMLIALLIIYSNIVLLNISQGIILATAAVTIGLGALGAASGIGLAAARSCYQIASEPGNYGAVFRATLLVVAFIESMVIYALIVAMLLLRQAV